MHSPSATDVYRGQMLLIGSWTVLRDGHLLMVSEDTEINLQKKRRMRVLFSLASFGILITFFFTCCIHTKAIKTICRVLLTLLLLFNVYEPSKIGGSGPRSFAEPLSLCHGYTKMVLQDAFLLCWSLGNYGSLNMERTLAAWILIFYTFCDWDLGRKWIFFCIKKEYWIMGKWFSL